ncbi:MAG: YebC/PmpR family DNA-binding transcriptional regulator [Terrimicrobiaceae bacterium]|nr:YebC/PmpR family DNA-binding transcriptional regulator [Terrimicrobiaceae bacterium]
MAGHNKWSKVKRLKGALDAKRGKLFSKLSKEISVAVRLGGGNPAFNPRLRAAVLAARAQSMPNDNIERAIKKGSGEIESGAIEEIVYEGYGPGGVAILVETATDNRNRTAADMRSIFTKNHGNLGSSGSVSYLFDRVGQVTIPLAHAAEDQVLEATLEAGADELTSDDEHHIVITQPDRLYAVAEALKSAGLESDSQKLTFVPRTTTMVVDPQAARQVLRLCDALDENDDVLSVHANFEIPEDILAGASSN